MLIRYEAWLRVRDRFEEDEKTELNRAITGETICPRAIVVGDSQLRAGLRAKVTRILNEDTQVKRLAL